MSKLPRSAREIALIGISLAAAACAAGIAHAPLGAPLAVDAAEIAADVAWLADPAREGRGLATAGLQESAQYLARELAGAGIEPAGDGGTFLQRFELSVAVELERASLDLNGDSLLAGTDFSALISSESGALPREVVFVGFGISAPERGRDEYAGVVVAGRTVLVIEGAPSAFSRRDRAAFARRSYKLAAARRHGAAAVLLAPKAGADAGPTRGADPEGGNPTRPSVGVVALELSRGAAERITRSSGVDLASLEKKLDAGEIASRALDASLGGDVRVKRTLGNNVNVVGMLRGSDPQLAREAVVIGAHYDHLGRGEFGSLAPERRGQIHPGADDNASGIAALVAIARAFAEGPRPKRTLVFAAFAAEEVGLLGSAHYVAHPAVPLRDTVAMLNLDMIGRPEKNEVVVFGDGTARGLRALAERAALVAGLHARFESDGFGPSDHASFVAERVPVLFFFTGTHAAYHTPDDTAEGVSAGGVARVAELTARVASALANAPQRPKFRGEAPAAHGAAPLGGGYGPYLGTVPAFGGPPVRGVRISGVRPGSPAEKAGLRGGDVIVEFAGDEVTSLEEYSSLLFTREPGEEVEIVVMRRGERVNARAVLGRRR